MTGVFVRGNTFLSYFGETVGALGDVNGNGHGDLVFGQGIDNPSGAGHDGKAFVILGRRGGVLFRDGFEMGDAGAWSNGP